MSQDLGILESATVFVHAIEFDPIEMVLQIHYQEKRETSENILITKTLTYAIDSPIREEIFTRLQEQALYVIDEAAVELRNPQPPE